MKTFTERVKLIFHYIRFTFERRNATNCWQSKSVCFSIAAIDLGTQQWILFIVWILCRVHNVQCKNEKSYASLIEFVWLPEFQSRALIQSLWLFVLGVSSARFFVLADFICQLQHLKCSHGKQKCLHRRHTGIVCYQTHHSFDTILLWPKTAEYPGLQSETTSAFIVSHESFNWIATLYPASFFDRN